MSNFFDNVINDAKGLEEKLLGPDYPYYKFISTPGEMNMSSEGSLSATSNNVAGLINYVQMMVEGTGPGNHSGNPNQPLGNKFFLQTGAQCMDNKSKQLVDRYMYINNIPDGSIPLLTKGAGIAFKDFRGLIPGIMGNLEDMNPLSIFKGFMEGNNPPCTSICMDTVGQPSIDGSTNPNQAGHMCKYVSDADIANIPPCSFPDGKNPQTKVKCRSTFTTLQDMERRGEDTTFRKYYPPSAYPSKESYNNFYIFLCGLVMIFILQRLLKKN